MTDSVERVQSRISGSTYVASLKIEEASQENSAQNLWLTPEVSTHVEKTIAGICLIQPSVVFGKDTTSSGSEDAGHCVQ